MPTPLKKHSITFTIDEPASPLSPTEETESAALTQYPSVVDTENPDAPIDISSADSIDESKIPDPVWAAPQNNPNLFLATPGHFSLLSASSAHHAAISLQQLPLATLFFSQPSIYREEAQQIASRTSLETNQNTGNFPSPGYSPGFSKR